ncbi:hypothetical protein ACOMHN_022081 [Nucella lapillus]
MNRCLKYCKKPKEKVSKLALVDLAGSERAQKSGAEGVRLKEGGNINKSLSLLGRVIRICAENTKKGKDEKPIHVPWLESALTKLLKDKLGGDSNSKTVMVATISPAGDNFEETMSTLKYASFAKLIVNQAIVNEDPTQKLICQLREQVESLRQQLCQAQEKMIVGELEVKGEEDPEMIEQLQNSEHLIKEMTKTWEEKVAEKNNFYSRCQEMRDKMGVSLYSKDDPRNMSCPHLVSLNPDPQLNERLVIHLSENKCRHFLLI